MRVTTLSDDDAEEEEEEEEEEDQAADVRETVTAQQVTKADRPLQRVGRTLH